MPPEDNVFNNVVQLQLIQYPTHWPHQAVRAGRNSALLMATGVNLHFDSTPMTRILSLVSTSISAHNRADFR